LASRRKARVLAFQALYAWEMARGDPDEVASLGWLESDKRAALDEETLAFVRLLVIGAIESVGEIDAALKRHLEHWDIKRISKVDLSILRLGAYALMRQRDIPATVSIDESIEIAKEYGSPDSYKFVNGVLDGLRKALEASDGKS
jgi:transcription antitermination protein NusB